MPRASLALAALLAGLAAAARLDGTDCFTAPGWDAPLRPALRIQGREHALWLAWRTDADRAAAALLLRTLAAHPRCARVRCRLALCHAPRGICGLTASNVPGLEDAIVAGFEPISELGCAESPRQLSAVGRAPAPLWARAHVALSVAAAARAECRAAAEPSFLADASWARACGFAADAPSLRADSPSLRAALQARVEAGADSFRFRDAELWADSPRVLAVRDGGAAPALLVAEDTRLRMYAPWLLAVLRARAPAARELRALLAAERAAAGAARGAAALRAAGAAGAAGVAGPGAARPERYRALVFLCAEDGWGAAHADYARLEEAVGRRLESETTPHSVVVQIETEPRSVSCLSDTELGAALQRWLGAGGQHRVLGAVAAGAGAGAAARLAAARGAAVLTYDTQAGGAAPLQLGPRAEALAAALSALLAACGWARVAVLSERGAAAARVAAGLRAAGAVRHAALPADARALRATLRALDAQGARVVVLNAAGPGARRALEAARAARLGADWAWVAREWTHERGPPLRLLTLRTPPRAETAALLRAVYGGRAGPARAAPLAEALLTLALGYTRLFAEHEELRYDHVAEDTLGLLRQTLTGRALPGVNLTFDSRGAEPSPPLLELWEAHAARPSVVRLPDDCPRVVERPACALPVGGDAFAPAACLDLCAALGAPALLLLALVGARGAAVLRRRRAARSLARLRRLRAEASAALLARQRHAGPALRALLVDRSRVTLLRALGAGRHGTVWLARLAGSGARLAAKAPHAGCSPAEEGELLREAAVLAPLRHAHVLRALGVCVGPGPPLLLTAAARHGDLLRYLRARRPPGGGADEAAHVAAPALTRLAREAALALRYLGERGLVHCDVRAANCLLDARRSLLLADFGMARALDAAADARRGEECYRSRRRALFPVLWMAPESLARGAFSRASDVWALGVLALELVTLGARPFGALGAAEAVALVTRGGHARLPAGASPDTRRLARACWRREPGARPSAADVAAWLEARPAALTPCPAALDGDSGFDSPDAS